MDVMEPRTENAVCSVCWGSFPSSVWLLGDGQPVGSGRGFRFETYRDGYLRTVGTGYQLPSQWSLLEEWDGTDAQALGRMFEVINPQATAQGKLLFLSVEQVNPAACCYQVKGRKATPVWCGNATAGACAVFSSVFKRSQFQFYLRCGGCQVEVLATVLFHDKRFHVTQSWRISHRSELEETRIEGRRAVVCRLFNDYVLVEGPLSGSPERLLKAAFRTDSLRMKLAVIECSGPIPLVTFWNCNGRHGAAPQTGLATLSVVALRVPWLRKALNTGLIQTPAGVEGLPAISIGMGGALILDLPMVEVQLKPL